MWRASLILAGLTVATPAAASFLDTDFFCLTYGCAVVHDGTTYDIYDNWQFATNSCCVGFGEEMIPSTSRATAMVTTGTLDVARPGLGEGESLLLDISDASGARFLADNGDGVLDASDSLGVFQLNSSTDLGVADSARTYSHSFYISSRNTRFSLRAVAQISEQYGDLGDTVTLGDIKLTPSVTRRGNDDGWEFGQRANRGNITIVKNVDDLGDLSSGPVQIMDFRRQSGIRQRRGDINEQVLRLDFLYELPEYDMSMGTGSLGIDVDFLFYRER